MTPKRPKPPDNRAKEQKIRKRMEKTEKNKFKHLKNRCPHCDKTSIVLIHLSKLKKMGIYCSRCFCGDLIYLNENSEDIYYYNKFKDYYEIARKASIKMPRKAAAHYFNGNLYVGSLKDFKEQIVKKLLEVISETTHENWSFLRSYAEETGNPYNLIRSWDEIDFFNKYCKGIIEELEKSRSESISEAGRELGNKIALSAFRRAIYNIHDKGPIQRESYWERRMNGINILAYCQQCEHIEIGESEADISLKTDEHDRKHHKNNHKWFIDSASNLGMPKSLCRTIKFNLKAHDKTGHLFILAIKKAYYTANPI